MFKRYSKVQISVFSVVLFTIFLTTASFTYAYFNIQVSGNENASNQIVEVGNMLMTYTDGPEIYLNRILPGTTVSKTFSVENTGTLGYAYRIGWESLTNGIENDELLMDITCTSYIHYGQSNQAVDGTCDGLLTSPVGNDVNEPIFDSVYIDGDYTHVYNMTITFVETSSEQNYNQEKVFYGVLNASETLEKVTLRGALLNAEEQPIVDATVEVHSTVKSDVTDSEGKYEIPGIEVGNHTMIVKDSEGNVIATNTFTLGAAKSSEVVNTDITWDRTKKDKELNIVLGESTINQFVIVDGAGSATTMINSYQDYGLVKIDHAATTLQNYAVSDYRYQGANPSNYVTFNDEEWRIIGIFNVENGDGIREDRIKLIRSASAGSAAWSHNSTDYNIPDWSVSTLKTLLNSGPYFNKTNGGTQVECSTSWGGSYTTCNYADYGLKFASQALIADSKYYMGTILDNKNSQESYISERTDNATYDDTWVGKVAIPYVSDYGYASSACYGSTMVKEYFNANCLDSNWMDFNEEMITLGTFTTYPHDCYFVTSSGSLDKGSINNNRTFRPVVYLNGTVKFKSGTGTQADPFKL